MGRKIIILLGHPGVGKGTQAKEIMRVLNIPQISTGDMLRDAIARKTSYGLEAKEKMDAGALVSDDIVNGIVAERIRMEDTMRGFILDGYPRTVSQAETFSRELRNRDHLFVIEIGADPEHLISRLVGRLMCPSNTCGEIYNIYSRVPKSDRLCDRCGSSLVHRSDDREDLIRERFRTYREETYPLVDFYEQKKVFHKLDGMRPIHEVTKDILDILDSEEEYTPSPVKGGNRKFA